MNSLNFQSNPPVAEIGIPFPRVTFSGGRLAADMASHGGLTAIRFFGEQRLSDAALFQADPISAFCQLFRPYADFGKHNQYFLEFTNTGFYPFGYDSECLFRGVSFRHRLTLLNDALLFELEGGGEFDLKLGVTFAAAPVKKHTRSWTRFHAVPGKNGILAYCVDEYPDNILKGDAEIIQNRINAEPCRSQTLLAVGSACPFRFSATAHDIQKDYFSAAAQNGYAAIAVVFGSEQECVFRRLQEVAPSIEALAAAEREKYRVSLQKHTALHSHEHVLNSFIGNMPEVLRSLEVKDIPGGVCASNTGYWIWGWDSMVHTDAIMMAGDWESVFRRLRFYRDGADPQCGIFHAINSSGKVIATMAPAAQTIYCVMLYNYFLFSRDKKGMAKFYPFAANLLARVEHDLVPEAGLYQGTGLYPDFPEDLKQTGHDISSFNNSILFQALRSMAALAGKLEKTSDANRWNQIADRLQAGFRTYLYDSETHYFYDSIDSKTLQPRKFYPVYAILYLTPFAAELVKGQENEIAKYMAEAFTQRHGVSMFARDTEIFYSDGNQLGMYSAVTEGFYRRMMQQAGKPDALLPIIVADWEKLQLSEAASCEAVNMGITPDGPGKKQMYAAVSYYSLIFHVFCGLEMRTDVLHFNPPSQAEDGWKIEHFKIGVNEFSIEFYGRGDRVGRLLLDGEKSTDMQIIPDLLKPGHHKIQIFLEQ
ncbi:MAG: hypothetical protein WC637_03790 [Victivallales bacterium]|jgi:hypothetical protein